MVAAKREISRADVLPMAEYAKVRAARRRKIAEHKAKRRLEIGPDACFLFESFETMWWQVHEMLYVEHGGEEEIHEQLSAYDPLVPKGDELVATLMFEIDDRRRRERVLGQLGGVEHTVSISFAGETVAAAPEGDVERSTAEGRASAVHFLHFPFTRAQIAKFRAPGCQVIVGIGHPNYAHMAVMPETVRAALSEDFD